MCASETILTPMQSARLGTDAQKIKKEMFQFKNNKYADLAVRSINGESIQKDINEKKNNKKNKNNDNNNKDENCDDDNNVEIIKSEQDLHQSIAFLNDKDISLCIFKIGFGKGNSNPVTDSTSFFKPNKDQDQAGDDVTYTNGIVHSSKIFVFFSHILRFRVSYYLVSEHMLTD